MGGTSLLYAFPAYAVLGVAAVLSFRALPRPSVQPCLHCLGTMLLLAGYVVLRACFSPDAYLAQTDAWMAIGCVLTYLLTALYLPQARYRNWLVCALLLVALAHMAVGAIQFKNGNGFMLFGVRGGAFGSRASGLFPCPNQLACFLETMAMLAVGITIWSRYDGSVKMVAGYVALMCILGLVISGSRGGYVSSAVGLLAFATLSLCVVGIFHPHRIVMAAMAAVVSLSFVLGSTLLVAQNSPEIKSRLVKIATFSGDLRWDHWQAAVDQFKTSPVLGTGAGTQPYYGQLFSRSKAQAESPHAQNDYLELLADYGLVGGILAMLFLSVHIYRGLQTVLRIVERQLGSPFMIRSATLALTLGALSAVATLLTHSLVDSNMHVPGNALLFAFLFATLGSREIERNCTDPAHPGEILFRKILVGVGIAVLVLFPFQYRGAKHRGSAAEIGKKEMQAKASPPRDAAQAQ